MKLLQRVYTGTTWQERWDQFKQDLPHQRKPYSKRNWGDTLHSLCSYQGKMKPALAFHLVSAFTEAGQQILDPFAGVGTIPFEAACIGVRAWGFDISPAALAIAKAKVGTHCATECNRYIHALEQFIQSEEPGEADYLSAHRMNFNSRIPDYFHPDTLRELLLARRYFMLHPPTSSTENLVFASMLHILHGNRPYALSRRSHPITPYKPTGAFIYKPLIHHLRSKIDRSVQRYPSEHFTAGQILHQDATLAWPETISQLDAIITSPPFFNSIRFHVGNWMRLWFSGWEREDFDLKPHEFIDEKQKQGFEVYIPILKQAYARLRSSGIFVLHLGISKKVNMAEEIAHIAKQWFHIYDLFIEDVTHTEKHGFRDKGTVHGHQYLILLPKT